jgi:hypothetical protein
MSRRRSKLMIEMDRFAEQLLQRANVSKVQPPEGDLSGVDQGPLAVEAKIAEQVAVFTAITRWVELQHKIDPEDAPVDFISRARRKLNRGAADHRGSAENAEDTGGSEPGDDSGAVGSDGGNAAEAAE